MKQAGIVLAICLLAAGALAVFLGAGIGAPRLAVLPQQTGSAPREALEVPVLALPSAAVPGSDGYVSVPVQLSPDGAAVTSLVFSLDIEQTCLLFDPVDADRNGRPDAVTVNLPASFIVSVAYDARDADGELDFVIADYSPPYTGMPEGPLVTVRLGVTCQPAEGAAQDIPLIFSSVPAASFAAPNGAQLPGVTVNGSVRVTSGAAAPVFAPTATATPVRATPTATLAATAPAPSTPQPDVRDEDRDGLFSREEGEGDWDADGAPNYLDSDDDGDGIPTLLENYDDVDGNGVPNYLDLDSNDNNIPDRVEAGPDPLRPADTNANGILDFLEIRAKAVHLPYIVRVTPE